MAGRVERPGDLQGSSPPKHPPSSYPFSQCLGTGRSSTPRCRRLLSRSKSRGGNPSNEIASIGPGPHGTRRRTSSCQFLFQFLDVTGNVPVILLDPDVNRREGWLHVDVEAQL